MSDADPMEAEVMTPDQVKAARMLLGWSQLQLSLRSDTSLSVVTTFERTGRVAIVQRRLDLTDPLAAIRTTLEEAGVKFTKGKAPGITAADTPPITPGQAKLARKLLRWSQKELGVQSGTSFHVVQMFERTGQVAKLYGRPTEQVNIVAALRAALEAAGIDFSNWQVPGVRGRTPSVRLRNLDQ